VAGSKRSSGPAPRYEYRVWGENLAALEARIEEDGHNGQLRKSVETYVVAPSNPAVNPKIRGGKLDVKVLVQVHEGLEQWEPRFKAAFPLLAEAVRCSFFPLLGLDAPELQRDEYTREQLLEDVVRPHPELMIARIGKRRRGFTIDGCLAEIATVDFADRSLQTVAIEGVDAAEVIAVGGRIGLVAHENVSYPAEICRLAEQAA